MTVAVPKQARYQTAPRPEMFLSCKVAYYTERLLCPPSCGTQLHRGTIGRSGGLRILCNFVIIIKNSVIVNCNGETYYTGFRLQSATCCSLSRNSYQ